MPRHPIALPIGQFYSHKDVAERKATIPDVVHEIYAVPRSEALRWLCALSKGILAEGGMNPRTQIQWARQLLPPEWHSKLETMMRSDGKDAGCIFHRRSVWLVLQLAITSCRDTTVDMPNEEVAGRLGRACFMASDVLTDIEAEWQRSLPRKNPTEWMVALLVPMLDSSSARIDFDLLGRAQMLWVEVAQDAEFQAELSRRKLVGFEEAFCNAHGISLLEFLRFLVALYVRFVGKQLEANLNPLLLDLASDEVGNAFSEDFREKAVSLISQTPEDLAIRLLRTRQSWAFDVTPIRERPLLEVMPGKYCCPDLTIFIRTFLDRIFFLLQDAYGKDEFRSLVGKLFECYVHRLVGEFAVTKGAGRTYAASPRFVGTQDEAADGILFWIDTAAVMEFKAGLLTTRQRFAGVPDEIFQGIKSLYGRRPGGRLKGVAQLAVNIARMLSNESEMVCRGDALDLSKFRQVFPVLVCMDEALGIHAVQKWLQPQFDAEFAKTGASSDRVGPLMVLTVRDFEALTTAGQSVSVEEILTVYAEHLTSQPKDYTGSFSSVLRYRFGRSVRWDDSLTCKKHREMIEELLPRFESSMEDDEAVEDNSDQSTDITRKRPK